MLSIENRQHSVNNDSKQDAEIEISRFPHNILCAVLNCGNQEVSISSKHPTVKNWNIQFSTNLRKTRYLDFHHVITDGKVTHNAFVIRPSGHHEDSGCMVRRQKCPCLGVVARL
jgi:hypothetical protein